MIKKKKSFTIIEVLVSIFILEIGIFGLADFYASSFKTARVARNETIASNLAAGTLDDTLSNSFSSLAVGDGTKVRYSDDPTNPFYNWYKKVDVKFIDPVSFADSLAETRIKKLIITVYWQDGTEKSFQTASIKTQK